MLLEIQMAPGLSYKLKVILVINAVIIDDESYACQALATLLKNHCPEVTVAATCQDPREAVALVENIKPQLVFLDIEMPHMNGFAFLEKCKPGSFDVIFTTSYDQYAIKAIRFSALDYLLKPVDIDDLRAAIQKVKERLEHKNTSQQYQSVLHNAQQNSGKIDRLAVPTQDGIEFFHTADIVYCEAQGSYTNILLKGKIKALVSRNLKDFENLLSDSGFCRVHHSFLINMSHVRKYVKGEGGYVVMTDDHYVDVSRRKKDEFLKLLVKV
jgi:two-component system LytT family response regulator